MNREYGVTHRNELCHYLVRRIDPVVPQRFNRDYWVSTVSSRVTTTGLSCVYAALACAAVCCSVLQCVAVCCSVLQCVAVCCSVLQCGTVWHSNQSCHDYRTELRTHVGAQSFMYATGTVGSRTGTSRVTNMGPRTVMSRVTNMGSRPAMSRVTHITRVESRIMTT